MIEVVNKKDCCGCSACVQKCPKHCISMEEDEEGFLYPKVDKEVCIDCGICEDVCPFANSVEPLAPLSVLAAKNRNERERMQSSSGGVFIALAREVLKEGGVVFGVSFDSQWNVKMCFAETMEEVFPMMGSKYVQAEMGNAYKRVEDFLKKGRIVMFTGCPCQIAGLHRFLKKKHDNLISVDCLCHGIPSPGVWRKFLEENFLTSSRIVTDELNTDTQLFSNERPTISYISFRDKTVSGWKKYNMIIRGKINSKFENGKVLLSATNNVNPFMRGFLSDLYIRRSCYACKCKSGRSHSDITIGDFWSIGSTLPDFDDDKGVSLVFLNTKEGQEIFYELDVDTRTSSIKNEIQTNGAFKEVIKENPKRELFFKLYNNGTPINEAVDTCLHQPILIRTIKTIKSHLKSIAKKALGKKNVARIKKAIR